MGQILVVVFGVSFTVVVFCNLANNSNPKHSFKWDTEPEELDLTLNIGVLLIWKCRLKLWPVITRSRGLMSTCRLRCEELTLGGADELPVRRTREMSLMRWIKPASFLSKLMELSSFLWPITICFISPTNRPSLSLCSGHAGKADVSGGLGLISALFSVKVIIQPLHYYLCLIRPASLFPSILGGISWFDNFNFRKFSPDILALPLPLVIVCHISNF